MNKQNRNSLTDTENKLRVAQWQRRLGGRVKNVKGLRSTDWWLQNSHGDVKYSIGDILSNIVITMYGAMWVL